MVIMDTLCISCHENEQDTMARRRLNGRFL